MSRVGPQIPVAEVIIGSPYFHTSLVPAGCSRTRDPAAVYSRSYCAYRSGLTADQSTEQTCERTQDPASWVCSPTRDKPGRNEPVLLPRALADLTSRRYGRQPIHWGREIVPTRR